jgi:4-oxalocrotonate tautomerase
MARSSQQTAVPRLDLSQPARQMSGAATLARGLKQRPVMPTIRVELFEGRTPEQKAALAREITAACVRVLGGQPGSIDILFYDIQRSDWATGGTLWSEKAPPPSP